MLMSTLRVLKTAHNHIRWPGSDRSARTEGSVASVGSLSLSDSPAGRTGRSVG